MTPAGDTVCVCVCVGGLRKRIQPDLFIYYEVINLAVRAAVTSFLGGLRVCVFLLRVTIQTCQALAEGERERPFRWNKSVTRRGGKVSCKPVSGRSAGDHPAAAAADL